MVRVTKIDGGAKHLFQILPLLEGNIIVSGDTFRNTPTKYGSKCFSNHLCGSVWQESQTKQFRVLLHAHQNDPGVVFRHNEVHFPMSVRKECFARSLLNPFAIRVGEKQLVLTFLATFVVIPIPEQKSFQSRSLLDVFSYALGACICKP